MKGIVGLTLLKQHATHAHRDEQEMQGNDQLSLWEYMCVDTTSSSWRISVFGVFPILKTGDFQSHVSYWRLLDGSNYT